MLIVIIIILSITIISGYVYVKREESEKCSQDLKRILEHFGYNFNISFKGNITTLKDSLDKTVSLYQDNTIQNSKNTPLQ